MGTRVSLLTSSTIPARQKRVRITARSLFPLFAVVFALTPLNYHDDRDDLKAPKILIVGAIALFAALSVGGRIRSWTVPAIVLVYSLVLVIQQLAIERGSLGSDCSTPSSSRRLSLPLALAALPLTRRQLEWAGGLAIYALSVITVVNFVGARLLGFGETFEGFQGGASSTSWGTRSRP